MATWPPENATIGLSPQDSIRWGSLVAPTWAAAFTGFPRDDNDLSILEPSSDSRIVYVDATLGNDGTGVIYTQAQAPDPYNYSPANPYLTITAAIALMRDGFPDWILLKTGESWDTAIPISGVSGRSDSERFVIASYGGGVRPEIRSFQTTSRCINFFKDEHWAIQGIDLYNTARDPASGDFVGYGNTGDVEGIYHFSNTNIGEEEKSNTLIENCRVRYFTAGIAYTGQAGGNNNVVRKNIIRYSWGEDSHSQGFWSDHRAVLCEQNVLDHNGWLIQSILGDDNKSQGQATKFNHNIYWAAPRETIIRDNTISQASSIGIKLTANSLPPFDTIESYDVSILRNFTYAGEVGVSAGGNDDEETGPRFGNMTVNGNVYKAIGVQQPTNRTLSWGIDIDDWAGTSCRNNYLLFEGTNPAVVSLLALGVKGHTSVLQAVENYNEGFPGPIADYMNVQPAEFVNVTVDDPIDLVSTPTIAEFLTDEGCGSWDAYIESIGVAGMPPTNYFINGAVK